MEFIRCDTRFEQYMRDESRLGGQADWIVFPQSAEELAAALNHARAQGLRVTVQGALTGIAGGAVPEGGLAVNLSRMNRIYGLRPEKDGLCVTLGAGATLSQLEEVLRNPVNEVWSADVSEDERRVLRGRLYAFGPAPTEKGASLGGLFACDAGGIHSLAFGHTGAQVEALCFVTHAGEILHLRRGEAVFDETGCTLPSGGRIACRTDLQQSPLRALMPCAGMDVIDFLAGSESMLGVVAELQVRLVAQPDCLWGVLYFFMDKKTEEAFLQGLCGQREGLIAAEYYDGSALRLVQAHKAAVTALKALPDFPLGAVGAVYVELAGEDEEMLNDRLFADLELFLACGGQEEHTWAACGVQETEKFRALRHGVPETVNTRIDALRQEFAALTKTAGDFLGRAGDYLRYLREYQADLAGMQVEYCLFGHIFENHFHINFLPENEEQMKAARELLDAWARRIAGDGGSIAAENGVGRLKREWAEGFLSAEQRAQRALLVREFGGDCD